VPGTAARAGVRSVNPHLPPPTGPGAIVSMLLRRRHLVLQMVRREVVTRYRGAIVGFAWSLLHPMLMLAVFTFVFSGVFKARWNPGGDESATSFALVLFVGLIIHTFFSECLARSPTLMAGNTNFVKKVVFPLEVLPVAVVGSALFHAGASTLILLVGLLVTGSALHPTLVLLPIVLLPLIIGTLGACWFLASIGTFVPDTGQVIGIVNSALLFLSPVFFPLSSLPEKYRSLVALNPLSLIIEQAREVAIWGRMPDWSALGLYTLGACLVCWAGFWWFQKTRKGFADVL